MDDREIIDTLSLINAEIFFGTENDNLGLNFSTNSFAGIISLGDFQLWCSEDDDREFNEETNSYEPFLGYLCKKIQDLSNMLIKISQTVENIKT